VSESGSPGAVNLLSIKASYYIPRQFAPRDANGKDIFEEDIKSRLTDALFVDDWDVYHVFHGEVHCGSLVKREIWDKEWWTQQP
jgi:hypothetical protein